MLPESGCVYPLLTEYLLSFYPNDVIHYTKDIHDIPMNQQIKYECVYTFDEDNEDEYDVERTLVLPDFAVNAEIANRINNTSMEFVLFTVFLCNKGECGKTEDHRKHSIVLIYNKTTYRIYAYDMFKFNYHGFDTSDLMKSLGKTFTEWLRQITGNVNIKFIRALNVSVTSKVVINWLRKKTKTEPSATEWHTLLSLWELDSMFMHTSLRKDDLSNTMIEFMSQKERDILFDELLDKWNAYVSDVFNAVLDENDCDESRFDWEWMKCVDAAIQSKSSSSMDIMEYTYMDRDELLNTRIGSITGILVMLMYFANKYPSCRVFLPKKVTLNTSKNNYAIRRWYDSESGWQMAYPKGLDQFLRKLKGNPDIDCIAIYLSLSSKPKADGYIGKHGNALVYNVRTKEIEHFEPHGSRIMDRYEPQNMYDTLEAYFKKVIPEGRYIRPDEFCHHDEFFQTTENTEKGYVDEHGMCAVWTLWYIDIRLANASLSKDAVVKKAMKALHKQGSFRRFITNYENYHVYMIKYLTDNYINEGRKQRNSPELDPEAYIPSSSSRSST